MELTAESLKEITPWGLEPYEKRLRKARKKIHIGTKVMVRMENCMILPSTEAFQTEAMENFFRYRTYRGTVTKFLPTTDPEKNVIAEVLIEEKFKIREFKGMFRLVPRDKRNFAWLSSRFENEYDDTYPDYLSAIVLDFLDDSKLSTRERDKNNYYPKFTEWERFNVSDTIQVNLVNLKAITEAEFKVRLRRLTASCQSSKYSYYPGQMCKCCPRLPYKFLEKHRFLNHDLDEPHGAEHLLAPRLSIKLTWVWWQKKAELLELLRPPYRPLPKRNEKRRLYSLTDSVGCF